MQTDFFSQRPLDSNLFVSRDDKRYTEKKNKTERARRKKEDTARLRQLVDLTLSLDPRIKRIKQEEKEAREAKKKGKVGGPNGMSAKQKAEEDKKKAEEEAKRKEEEEQVSLLSSRLLSRSHPACVRLLVPRQRRLKLLLLTLRRKLAELLELPRMAMHTTNVRWLFSNVR